MNGRKARAKRRQRQLAAAHTWLEWAREAWDYYRSLGLSPPEIVRDGGLLLPTFRKLIHPFLGKSESRRYRDCAAIVRGTRRHLHQASDLAPHALATLPSVLPALRLGANGSQFNRWRHREGRQQGVGWPIHS